MKGDTVRNRVTPVFATVLVWLAVSTPSPAAQRQQPPRLIVTNYTGAVVTLSIEVKNKAPQPRGRLNPGASVPIIGVSNGDRFRAEWQGRSRQKAVQLRYDQGYGGLQDTWTVR
jgi:hypothetical protein